ncbi:MAG: BspA family leucine-rich repeat surface protein, partial [Bacteroidota bacterium]
VAAEFNQDIGEWDVSKVEEMFRMFTGAADFNQDISGWTINSEANAEVNMGRMFENATSFNQDLGDWDVSKVISMAHMLDNSGMTTESYDATLIGWANNPDTPDDITLGADGIQFCNSFLERQKLINDKSWSIDDDDLHPDCI